MTVITSILGDFRSKFWKNRFLMSFDKLVWAKTCLGYAGWLQNMLRIDRTMFSDHLTLANIGMSIFDLQISTLGTTIGPQNLLFCPGVSQETFWFLRIDYRLSINDFDLPTPSAWWKQSLRRVDFSKKTPFLFWNFLQNTKTAKTVFFCEKSYP